MSGGQDAALDRMRETFNGREHDPAFELDDAAYLRYLRARNFDIEKSIAMLEATLEWRKQFGLKEIHESWMDTIRMENSTGKMYCRGFDRENHCIIYLRPKMENTHDHDGNLKHLVFNLERAIAIMKYRGQNVEKLSLVIDYDGYSLMNAPPMKTSNETLSILQNHYPERLFRAYCVQPPWIFNAFYKMISPFIDPVTKAKIVMVTGNLEQCGARLDQEIDLAALERSVGGYDARPFDSSVYLASDFSLDYLATLELPKGAGVAEAETAVARDDKTKVEGEASSS